jgi:hypothetical protein
MSVPLKVQLFDAFLGTQEGIHSIILPDIFSSGGSMNLFIDKYGRAKKIHGYSKANATAVTTDTGASATRLRNLAAYRQTEGGTLTRQLLGVFDDGTNEWELYYSTNDGANWTFIFDAGSGSAGQIADFAQFGDELYITNGKIAPRLWDGSSLTTAGATQSPTPTAAESSSVGNLLGTYKYKLVTVKSDGSRGKGSVTSNVLVIQDKQVDLTWAADADTDVVGYEVYRTTGTGNVFYFTSYVDGRTTVAFTDNEHDLTILESRVLQEHGDAPPTAYFCEPHKSRMWWLRTDAAPTRAYWSDPGDADSVLGENFLDFADSETIGDQITGALGNFEGRFVVFTERAIWTVSGTGQVIGNIVDWTRTRTNAGIGCVHHRSAVRVPAGSKYPDQNGEIQLTKTASIAYVTPLGDIRLFDGDNDIIISHPVKDTLAEFNYAQRAKTHAVIDSTNAQIIFFIPTGNSGEPDKAVVWNTRWGVWYVWDPMPFSSSVEVETSSDAALLLTGQADPAEGGYCYNFFSPTALSFDGDNIEAVWMTKTLHGVNEEKQPAFSNRKRWRWADFLFAVNQDVDLTVEWLAGASPNNAAALGSKTISPAASYLLTADGDRITSLSGDALTVSLSSAQAKALLHTQDGDYLHDEGIRLRVGDNASLGSWSLEAFTLAYQILPGLRRRDQLA